ncbi:putative amidohydrolase [Eubacterium multiforme]|uniref:Amidohydrolase n=1 Tax=Eubacterium multiforme TaxID=83339 RepID=A0ABT9UUQ4_9FIRM|nr:putative amidohydrolase [Eubacterium multiforme]
MVKVTIIEPNISKEENEANLKKVEEVLRKIAKENCKE